MVCSTHCPVMLLFFHFNIDGHLGSFQSCSIKSNSVNKNSLSTNELGAHLVAVFKLFAFAPSQNSNPYILSKLSSRLYVDFTCLATDVSFLFQDVLQAVIMPGCSIALAAVCLPPTFRRNLVEPCRCVNLSKSLQPLCTSGHAAVKEETLGWGT